MAAFLNFHNNTTASLQTLSVISKSLFLISLVINFIIYRRFGTLFSGFAGKSIQYYKING